MSTMSESRDWSKIRSAKRRLERAGFENVTETPIGDTVTAVDFHVTDPVWATKREEGSSLIINGAEFGTFMIRFPLINTNTVGGARLHRVGEQAVEEAGVPDLPMIETPSHENNRLALHISYEQGANEILTINEAIDYIIDIHENVIEKLVDIQLETP